MITATPVPILSDNYAWVLTAEGGDRAVVVDPGQAGPVEEHLRARGLHLAAVLITHHHADHVAGVADLVATWECPVYGPRSAALDFVDRPVADGDRIELGSPEIRLDVLAVPGHTLDHLAYPGPGAVLCGDTLFAGGCGRVFEGTPEMMQASLDRLAELPDDTAVLCAHEYTESNLRFAAAVEPENQAIARRLEVVQAIRRHGRPTVPSTLLEERATNPFLRTRAPAVVDAAASRAGRPVEPGPETFAVIRAWKDGFR